MKTAADLFRARRYRIFDLDGTLVDTLPDLTLSLNRTLVEFGLPEVSRSLVRESLHGGLPGTVDAAICALNLERKQGARLLQGYERHYSQALAAHSRPFDGVPELLQRLRELGAPLAVCTNKSFRDACRLLEELGLLEHFDAVIGAEPDLPPKPHPEPLLRAAARLDGCLEEALLIGDSVVDAQCAAAAGVACVIHAGGYGARGLLEETRFDSYWDLLRLLE